MKLSLQPVRRVLRRPGGAPDTVKVPPGSKYSGVTQPWRDLQASHFFGWFGITEVRRSLLGHGGSLVECKPGGFAESIDLTFEVDGDGMVGQAVLQLDRGWMADRGTAPFAIDIAKSFVCALAPEDRVVGALTERLEYLMSRQPGVLVRAGAVTPPDPGLERVVGPAVDVFAGARRQAELEGATCTLYLDHFNEVPSTAPMPLAGPFHPDMERPRSARFQIRWRPVVRSPERFPPAP